MIIYIYIYIYICIISDWGSQIPEPLLLGNHSSSFSMGIARSSQPNLE